MAIGVTYTSANGQTSSFNAEGASSVSEQIRQLQSMPMTNEAYHQLKELRRQKREERKAAHGMGSTIKEIGRGAANFVKNLIGFGSSIEEKNGKLQLVGDGFTVQNGYVYGKGKEGTKGFFPLTELLEFLDKREEGAVIGAAQSDDDNEQNDERGSDSNAAFTVTVVARIGIFSESTDGTEENIERTVTAFGRDVYFTGRGRAFKVGAERELLSFRLIGGGGGGEYIDRGCFAIRGGTLTNCYFWNGSQIYELAEMRIGESLASSVLAILISPNNDTAGSAEYAIFTSINELNEAAKSPDTVVIPLYQFNANLSVITDFRIMPRGDSWGIVI